MSEFFTLVVADSGAKILNLDQPLADEHHLSDVRDAGDPGVTNQLLKKRLPTKSPDRGPRESIESGNLTAFTGIRLIDPQLPDACRIPFGIDPN
jgi:hypothetical protein